jgi:hypothetical protein
MNSNRLTAAWEEMQTPALAWRGQMGQAFVMCPAALAAPWQQQLYQAAYERACVTAAPWPPPRLLASAN